MTPFSSTRSMAALLVLLAAAPVCTFTAVPAATARPSSRLFYKDEKGDAEYQKALRRHTARTDVKRFMTQRSIQSFVYLLQQCRDPHTVKWMEDLLDFPNLEDYHGTGAFDMDHYPTWDTILSAMMSRPPDVVVVSVRSKAPSQGSFAKNQLRQKSQNVNRTDILPGMFGPRDDEEPSEERDEDGELNDIAIKSKNANNDNPHVEEEFVEIDIDIDPPSLVSRIVSVRDQIAHEWKDDLETLFQTNDLILDTYMEGLIESRDGKKERKGEVLLFDRHAMMALATSTSKFNGASSPLRRSSFDLLVLLSTQESIHRVLRNDNEDEPMDEAAVKWLREFYSERVGEYFDGYQNPDQADAFLEELMHTPPRISKVDGKVNFVDPMYMAEAIIRERSKVAQDWKEEVAQTPTDHIRLRRDLLERQMMVRKNREEQESSEDDGGSRIFAKALSELIFNGEAFE